MVYKIKLCLYILALTLITTVRATAISGGQNHWAAKWVGCTNGCIPEKAFIIDGNAIGKGFHTNGVHVGYVSREKKGLVIGWGSREIVLPKYEVLTVGNDYYVLTEEQIIFRWLAMCRNEPCQSLLTPFFIPLKGGYETEMDHGSDGELWIGRSFYQGRWYIGRAGKKIGMRFGVDDREVVVSEYYEILAFKL